jgi:hypothetical protein
VGEEKRQHKHGSSSLRESHVGASYQRVFDYFPPFSIQLPMQGALDYLQGDSPSLFLRMLSESSFDHSFCFCQEGRLRGCTDGGYASRGYASHFIRMYIPPLHHGMIGVRNESVLFFILGSSAAVMVRGRENYFPCCFMLCTRLCAAGSGVIPRVLEPW